MSFPVTAYVMGGTRQHENHWFNESGAELDHMVSGLNF